MSSAKLAPISFLSKTEPDFFSLNSLKRTPSNKNVSNFPDSSDKKKELFKESFSQTSKTKKKTINCKKKKKIEKYIINFCLGIYFNLWFLIL